MPSTGTSPELGSDARLHTEDGISWLVVPAVTLHLQILLKVIPLSTGPDTAFPPSDFPFACRVHDVHKDCFEHCLHGFSPPKKGHLHTYLQSLVWVHFRFLWPEEPSSNSIVMSTIAEKKSQLVTSSDESHSALSMLLKRELKAKTDVVHGPSNLWYLMSHSLCQNLSFLFLPEFDLQATATNRFSDVYWMKQAAKRTLIKWKHSQGPWRRHLFSQLC